MPRFVFPARKTYLSGGIYRDEEKFISRIGLGDVDDVVRGMRKKQQQ